MLGESGSPSRWLVCPSADRGVRSIRPELAAVPPDDRRLAAGGSDGLTGWWPLLSADAVEAVARCHRLRRASQHPAWRQAGGRAGVSRPPTRRTMPPKQARGSGQLRRAGQRAGRAVPGAGPLTAWSGGGGYERLDGAWGRRHGREGPWRPGSRAVPGCRGRAQIPGIVHARPSWPAAEARACGSRGRGRPGSVPDRPGSTGTGCGRWDGTTVRSARRPPV